MTRVDGVQLGITVHLILGEYNNVINLESHKQQTQN